MYKLEFKSGYSGGFILSCPGDPYLQIPEKIATKQFSLPS